MDTHYLFCNEEQVFDDDDNVNTNAATNLHPLALGMQHLGMHPLDLYWEEEELVSLFAKEKDSSHLGGGISDLRLAGVRLEAIEWILRVNAYYSFSALTAVLAVNYLDRFLLCSGYNVHQRDGQNKPWMTQLVAVACMSLAAKVEETQVPLLLDLQVEETKYVFEAKTIQRMELFVMDKLHWKMNPVTPLSFVDHIIRRLGLKSNLHWVFLNKCEDLLLSVLADYRFVGYLPSVLATAIMLRSIEQIEHCNSVEYQNQLMDVLKISKVKVDECYQLILESTLGDHKRKHPDSPTAVFDASFSSDSSNDSWSVKSLISVSPEPFLKKRRIQDQQMKLPSFSRAFAVDVLTSPH